MNRVAWGMLLTAASLFSQNEPKPESRNTADALMEFALTESQREVAKMFGAPAQIAESGPNYFAWQYFLGHDSHDPSHYFVFSNADRKLVSVTRNADEEENVDALFPKAQTEVYHFKGGPAPYGARLRRLPGDRVLLAMGSTKPGQTSRQIMLIRRSALAIFLPWIHEQMKQ